MITQDERIENCDSFAPQMLTRQQIRKLNQQDTVTDKKRQERKTEPKPVQQKILAVKKTHASSFKVSKSEQILPKKAYVKNQRDKSNK